MDRHAEVWLKRDNSSLILTTKSEGNYASAYSKSGFDDTVESVHGLNGDYLQRGDAVRGMYVLVYMYTNVDLVMLQYYHSNMGKDTWLLTYKLERSSVQPLE